MSRIVPDPAVVVIIIRRKQPILPERIKSCSDLIRSLVWKHQRVVAVSIVGRQRGQSAAGGDRGADRRSLVGEKRCAGDTGGERTQGERGRRVFQRQRGDGTSLKGLNDEL